MSLGTSWELLVLLGALLSRLGTMLGRLGALLGRLGASWKHRRQRLPKYQKTYEKPMKIIEFGHLGAPLGRPLGRIGNSLACLGLS